MGELTMTKYEAVAKAVEHLEQAVRILREVRESSHPHADGPKSLRARREALVDQGSDSSRVTSVLNALHDTRREMVERLTEALPDKPDFLDPLRACLVRAEIVDQMEAAAERELSKAEHLAKQVEP